jgi:superfamily I DNA/RNA helicase/RecB family exonuclease
VHTIRLEPEDWPQALDQVHGSQLVVAGPGTGKTEFLVRRAIRLIEGGHASPGQIVVLTFSRRSAAELAGRIGAGLGRGSVGVDASTFHSFAHRLLETHWDGPVGSLLTGPEQIRIVGRLLAAEDPADWPLPFRPLLGSPTFAEEVADFLLRCRERLVGATELRRRAEERADWRALPAFFDRYDRLLRDTGRIDYGTLLVDAIDCLARPEVAAAVSDQHHFVLVDEYQDTSPAQARLLEALTARRHNLTVAGDPYQSIYSFRGAEVRNIADFAERFADQQGTVRLVLARSFRVPDAIMAAALRVVSSGELPGSAGPVTPAPHPGRVEAYIFDQQSAEAEWIASEVERLLVEEGVKHSRVAVLVRSKRRLLPELSRALERRRIPHDTPDSRLVDHPMIQVVLDLTRAAAWGGLDASEYPGAADEIDRLMRRVLLGPLLAVPVAVERELLRLRRRSAASWPQVLERLPEAGTVAELLADPVWATGTSATDGFWRLWTTIEAFAGIATDPISRDDRAALTSFAQALGRQAERDPSLTLLGYAELAEDDDFEATPLLSARRSEDRVVLTTLHQAKGLEFDVVFIADAAEDVFPDTRRSRALLQPHLLSPDRSPDAAGQIMFRLQEEMRLAYTAMTRARSRVVWTATGAGIEESGSRPSRFLLAAADVEAVTDLGAPPDRTGDPVSALEVETRLRRSLVDPTGPAAERLAAVTVLAHPVRADSWDPEAFAGLAEPGPDSGIVEQPVRLSPSQAEAYETCPRRYAFERRVRLQSAASPYLTFGALVHAVLEGVERKALQEGRPRSSADEALRHLDELVQRADFGSPVLAQAWRRRAGELFQRLYREWPTDSAGIVTLERNLELEIDGIRWLGRADRIERTVSGALRIVDYKTGGTPLTKLEAGRSLQLGFYVMAASADRSLSEADTPIEAQLWYPLAKAKSWRPTFDPAMLTTVRERLLAAAQGIGAEDWTPRVGAGCRTCPVRLVCDRWPEGREAFVE